MMRADKSKMKADESRRDHYYRRARIQLRCRPDRKQLKYAPLIKELEREAGLER